MKSVKQEFINIINEYSQIEATMQNVESLDLISDCGYDSIQMIELICTVEDVFGIEVEDEYMLADKIRNLREFLAYIEGKIDD